MPQSTTVRGFPPRPIDELHVFPRCLHTAGHTHSLSLVTPLGISRHPTLPDTSKLVVSTSTACTLGNNGVGSVPYSHSSIQCPRAAWAKAFTKPKEKINEATAVQLRWKRLTVAKLHSHWC